MDVILRVKILSLKFVIIFQSSVLQLKVSTLSNFSFSLSSELAVKN